MTPSPLSVWRYIGLVILVCILVSCTLPAQTQAARATLPPPAASYTPVPPKTHTAAPSPAVLVTPAAAAATASPLPAVTATPGATLAASASPAPLDRKDPNSLIAALRSALERKDASFFEPLAAEKLSYLNYIEGGQPVTRAQLIADLTRRLGASNPTCTAYGSYEQTLQVWTSGWSPEWQIDQTCYQGCNPVNPPFKSKTAAFFFTPASDGSYQLSSVWVNDDQLWRTVYNVTMRACDQPYPTPAPSATLLACPGAPAPRLAVGAYAYASADTATSNRVRSDAGTGARIVGLLPPGGGVQVLEGPTCANGYVWWKVKLTKGDLTGWTAEGAGSQYWLVPCSGTEPCKAQ